jgi:hypothetical protein
VLRLGAPAGRYPTSFSHQPTQSTLQRHITYLKPDCYLRNSKFWLLPHIAPMFCYLPVFSDLRLRPRSNSVFISRIRNVATPHQLHINTKPSNTVMRICRLSRGSLIDERRSETVNESGETISGNEMILIQEMTTNFNQPCAERCTSIALMGLKRT